MEIEKYLEEAKHKANTDTDYGFSHEELYVLLHKVAKDQREICADNAFWESGKETDQYYLRESIIDAPSPLKKE